MLANNRQKPSFIYFFLNFFQVDKAPLPSEHFFLSFFSPSKNACFLWFYIFFLPHLHSKGNLMGVVIYLN